MKNCKTIYFVLSLIGLVAGGCESYIKDVKLPEFEKKMTLFAFLNPQDSVTYLTVGSNQNLFGELNKAGLNGKTSGTISDGVKEITLDPYKNGLKFRKKDFPLEYGKSYFIKISNDEGLQAEASCHIPRLIRFNIRADTFSIVEPFIYEGKKFRRIDYNVHLTDPQGEENYYRFLCLARTYYTNPINRKKYSNRTQIDFEKSLFSDAGKDGMEITAKTDYGLNYFFESNYDSAFITFYILNTERSYFLYHNSLQKYTSGDNPFSEVTPVFSNVSGGLGVFTSYTIDSLVIRVR